MSKASKRARWEAEAKARAEAAPSAEPPAAATGPEEASATELSGEASAVVESASESILEPAETPEPDSDPVSPAAPEPARTPPPITFAPDGTRYADMPNDGVRCECLANFLWRGAVVAPPTVVTMPEGDAVKAELKGLVRRL